MDTATRAKVEAIRQAQLKGGEVLQELVIQLRDHAIELGALAAALEEVARAQQEQVVALEELPWAA